MNLYWCFRSDLSGKMSTLLCNIGYYALERKMFQWVLFRSALHHRIVMQSQWIQKQIAWNQKLFYEHGAHTKGLVPIGVYFFEMFLEFVKFLKKNCSAWNFVETMPIMSGVGWNKWGMDPKVGSGRETGRYFPFSRNFPYGTGSRLHTDRKIRVILKNWSFSPLFPVGTNMF